MKTYKLSEVTKMLEENPKLSFKHVDGDMTYVLSCDEGYLDFKVFDECNVLISDEMGGGKFNGNLDITYEWTLVPQEVSFMDALKAYESGQKIYSNTRGMICTYAFAEDGLKDDCGDSITSGEILYGKWYIGEPNE